MEIKKIYKKRYYMLSGGLILLSILIFYLALLPTIQTGANVRILKRQIALLQSAPSEIAGMEKKLVKLQQEIGMDAGKFTDTQKALLEAVSNYCKSNGILIREFPQLHIAEIKGYRIETHRVTIEGGFIPLLLLLNKLEREFSLSRVVSVGYQSQYDMKQKRTRLLMSIYLQAIKNKENE